MAGMFAMFLHVLPNQAKKKKKRKNKKKKKKNKIKKGTLTYFHVLNSGYSRKRNIWLTMPARGPNQKKSFLCSVFFSVPISFTESSLPCLNRMSTIANGP